MGWERSDAGGNLGYPDTAYNVTEKNALAYKGSAMGTGSGQTAIYKIEYLYDFANLPASFTSESDGGLAKIPSQSIIKSVDVQVDSTVSGGANFSIGLSKPDGTVLDADGLVAASTITANGAYSSGGGALIGTAVTESQVTVGGDRTAGKIKVVVEYSFIYKN